MTFCGATIPTTCSSGRPGVTSFPATTATTSSWGPTWCRRKTTFWLSCSASTAGDIILGSVGNDTLIGGKGNDALLAFGGHDVLQGKEGNDALIGHYGDDFLDGGDGNEDECNGSEGSDASSGCEFMVSIERGEQRGVPD